MVGQPTADQSAFAQPSETLSGASIPQPEIAALQPEDPFLAVKKGVLQYLLQMARLGRDARFHAEMFLETVDTGDETPTALLGELTSKDFNSWFTDLQKVDATIITQRAWFSDFYETVRASLAGQESERGENP
jgi:hypothetical protein